MATVTSIRPDIRAIECPAPLRDFECWLLWRFEQFQGEAKPRKIPFYHTGTRRRGKQGSPADRAQLTTFAVAREAAVRRGFDGVGLALISEFGITALDFDNCIGPNGELPPEVEHVAARTYAERSPSGKGIRAFMRGDLGNHKSPSSREQFGFEVFSSSGFTTLTGDILDATDILGLHDTIAPVDEYVTNICKQRFAAATSSTLSDDFTAGYEPVLGLSEAEMQSALDALDPSMGRDPWIKTGMALHHETEGGDDGFALWDEWSSAGATYPGEEGLRAQWDSFTRRVAPGRAQVTMASVLKMARQAREDDAPKVATVAQVEAQIERLALAEPAAAHPSTGPAYTGKFAVTHAAAMSAQKPVAWLVKGVVPQADLGMIFGASGSGKSFVSIDLAMSIARGVEWRGRRVQQGSVIIVAAEGAGSYGKRIKAYCQHHQIDAADLPLGVITDAPNLLEADDVSELAASVQAAGGAALLIIDTLAQVTPGANENASEDMGRAIANAQVLRRVTGAMVLVIHHAGKDTLRGARGWSGWKGALDVEIEVSRDELSEVREIRLSKMKDEEDGLRFGFKLDTITVGMDADGDELRSCIVVEDEVRAKSAGKPSTTRVLERSAETLAVIEVLETFTTESVLSLDALIRASIELLPSPRHGEADRRRQSVKRAIDALAKEKEGPLSLAGNNVILY